jgi:hypothetical protein
MIGGGIGLTEKCDALWDPCARLMAIVVGFPFRKALETLEVILYPADILNGLCSSLAAFVNNKPSRAVAFPFWYVIDPSIVSF